MSYLGEVSRSDGGGSPAKRIQHLRHQHPAGDGEDEGQHRRDDQTDHGADPDPDKGIGDGILFHHLPVRVFAVQFICRGGAGIAVFIGRGGLIRITSGSGPFGAKEGAHIDDHKIGGRGDSSHCERHRHDAAADDRDQQEPDQTS